jgi:outer membrane protein assembly factor BamB
MAAGQYEQADIDYGAQISRDAASHTTVSKGTDLLFKDSREGRFYALDARTGELLSRASLGGQGANGPMAYAVGRPIRCSCCW